MTIMQEKLLKWLENTDIHKLQIHLNILKQRKKYSKDLRGKCKYYTRIYHTNFEL
jgi:hypothetical protein